MRSISVKNLYDKIISIIEAYVSGKKHFKIKEQMTADFLFYDKKK